MQTKLCSSTVIAAVAPGVRMAQVLCLVAIATWTSCVCAAAAVPSRGLSDMAGSWFGGGRVYLSNGSNERITCRATYDVSEAGRTLQQHLLCASDSYRFDIGSRVTEDQGRILGTWSEATRNVSGNLNGVARGGQVWADVNGNGFQARLALVTSGNSQRVTITPNGSDVREVTVALRRR
jgi:hypothetical protein